MMRFIFLSILAVFTAVNLVLLWQVYRKMKQNMDKKLETVEPYIMTRLTVFGINMVFGYKADQAMTNEQRLFLPEELMFYLSEAQLADGTSLIKNQHIQAFPIANVPWYADCRWGFALFAILMIGISCWDRRRNKLSWWLDVMLCLIYLILIIIVIFLTFFSIHPLVGFNWRLIIFPSIHLCARLIYWLR